MSLNKSDAQIIQEIVNQGIDARLEAVTNSSFNWDSNRKLNCSINPKDMLVILRRLSESEQEDAMNLRSDILSTLEIEEI